VADSDITVVTPTIPGREDLLARAVASVDAQLLPPARHIVVIDSRQRGAAWARNRGLEQVETTWVAWLDDDDTLDPDHLQVLHAAVSRETPPPDLAYTYPRFVDDRGGEVRDPLATVHHGQLVAEPVGVPFGAEQSAWLHRMGNFIPITYLVRASLVRQVGGFPQSGGPGREEDYQLLVNLLDAGAHFFHVTDRRTWTYHLTGRNTGGGAHGTGASNREAFRP
jgi:glycosyltransferase involved in cell wall biosynthesis